MASRIEEYEGIEKVLREAKAKIRVKREAESVPPKRSYGRIVSEDVLSPMDVPSHATSHMDGFAVIAEDLASASQTAQVQLRLVGELGPGSRDIPKISHGETVRVATGAPIPDGADTVVPVEQAAEKEGRISVGFAPGRGSWTYARGSDIHRNEVVIRKGRRVRAQEVGLILSLAMVKTWVYKKPKVAVIATGSELTDEAPTRGKVKNSHSPIFLRLVRTLGCQSVDMGVTKDSPLQIRWKIRAALRRSDFVLTQGGTSAGKHDLVSEAVRRMRPEVFFHGIRIDRGRVAGYAVVKGKPILMLPGPIQGAMTAFVLLGLPTIGLVSGATINLPRVTAKMDSEWKARERFSGFTKVVYVKLLGEGRDVAVPLIGDTESMSVLTKADGYVVVPEKVSQIQAGDKVEVRLLPGFSFV